MADAEAAAALQAQITAAVVAALAAQAAAVPAQVAHVAVKLPEFWVKDPKMWFAQAEAQFRRARVTAETTMYDYILMKLPQDVVMSVRALVSAIEADPVKQEQSYTLMKEALLGSYGMTKWQMAYALLDHPDLGDRRPSAMMAEMLSLRFETTAPDSLFLALFLRRLPPSIRDHLSAANHTTATLGGESYNGDRDVSPCRYSLGCQKYIISLHCYRVSRRRVGSLRFARPPCTVS